MADPADVRRNTRAAIQDFLQRSSMGGSGTGIPMQPTGGRPTPDPTPVQRLGQFLSKVWDTSNQAQALTEQAQYAAPFDLAEQAARLYDENQYAIDSWTDPLDGVSKLLGSLVSLENPISWGEGGMDGPTFSEALMNRGVPEGLAMFAELFVPDPTGAGKLDEMIPLLGFVPFLRSLRSNPQAMARLSTRAQHPGGVPGFFEDMEEGLGAFVDQRYGLDEATLGLNSKPTPFDSPDPGNYMVPGRSGPPGLHDTHLRLQVDPEVPNGIYVPTLFRDPSDSPTLLRSFFPALDVADANQVVMRTMPEAFGHKSVPTRNLYGMYARSGFEYGYSGGMVRRPLPVDDAARAAEEAARTARRQRVEAAMEAQQITPAFFRYYGENGPEGLHAILDVDSDGNFFFLYPDGSGRPYGASRSGSAWYSSQIEQLYPDLPYLLEDVVAVTDRLGSDAAYRMLTDEGVDSTLASQYVQAIANEVGQ